MAKAFKVKAKKNGYRRAGFGFSDTEDTTLLVDKLSKEQVEALKGDKNLLVVEVDVKGTGKPDAEGDDKDKTGDKDKTTDTGTKK